MYKFIKNCIEDTVKELNNINQNIVLSSEENIAINNFFEKHIKKETSMRKIKEQTSNTIRNAFANFILTADDINLGEYNGPRKEVKLKWSNDKFKCSEVVHNN